MSKDYVKQVYDNFYFGSYGSEEELTICNLYIPAESEYVETDEDVEEVLAEDIVDFTASDKTGACWEGYERVPNTKEGEPGSCRKKGSARAKYKYENPKTGEVFTYSRRGTYKKDGTTLLYKGKAAEYQGRKVKLGKPFRTPDGPKKFSVYVKNEKGNVVKVNFGDPNMEIKKDNPKRRKSFRARHRCDTPGPRWKARYWSCKKW